MAKLPAQDIVERLPIEKQIKYALFLAAGQDDPHSVTITELCASLSRLTADNEAERAAMDVTQRRAIAAEARADALAQEVERLKAALAEAGESLDWAARRMKGNCSGSDVNAVMLAAGRTADARAALGGSDHG